MYDHFGMMSNQERSNVSCDVFGLGQCALDYIVKTDEYPPADVKCECFEMTMQGGGPVATALVALSRWGMSCTLAGVVGDDEFGGTIARSLEDEGVDISGLVTRRGGKSQFAFIVAEPGVGRRTIFWLRPTGDPPRMEELDLEKLKAARVFHTDGLFMDVSLEAAREARRAGVEVVVDAGTLREGMLDLARASDYFIASQVFAEEMVGPGDPEGACRKLADMGPRVTAVTLGAEGYAAWFDGRTLRRPAYEVEAVDTTGCGDVFHAGFIYGLLKGWRPEESLEYAAWAASRVSTALGGRAGIPPASQWKGRRKS